MLCQTWTNCTSNADRVRSGAQNLWDAPEKPVAHILSCIYKKIIRSISWIGKAMKKLQVTSYYRLLVYYKLQRTCNTLMFIYLMASKLLYLLMDWETFHLFPALEQIKGVIRALQTPMTVFLTKIATLI